MLTLEKVACRAADDTSSPTVLLKGISFTLKAGELTALFGPSGGGKSTLLRLLVRFLEPVSGMIVFQQRDLASWEPRLLRRKIGLVRQQAHMFDGTVLDNLQLPFRWQKQAVPEPASAPIDQVLDWCQLKPELLNKPADQLSIGQKQRVALARTLLLKPELLLLDEPTSALDRPTADQVGETLRRLKQERQLGILLVSHDLRQLERIADRGLFLADGQLVEQGPMPQLLRQPQTLQLRTFLAETGDGHAE
ncbi:MAG TPA: ABC transporter ATP-binding protein [Geothermobacteraceae bacterium]|nr:ABC transporter ATP-binding protein [Geothermobacteraceae bacterium]